MTVRARFRAIATMLCLGVTSLLLFASPASAGVYEVRNCGGSASAHLDSKFERYGDGRIDVTETCSRLPGGAITIRQRRHGGVMPEGFGGGYRWQAPAGAVIVASSVTGRLRNANGIAAQFYAADSSGGYLPLDGGTPHDGQLRHIDLSFPGRPRSQIVGRLACLTNPPCSNRPTDQQAYIQIRRLALKLRDSEPPSITAGGRLFTGPRAIRGAVEYSLAAWDTGSGVWKLHALVNGHEVELTTVHCPGDRGGYADRTQPCPSSATSAGHLDTSEPPFRQGTNTVMLCARDYANGHPDTPGGPNTGCSGSRTVTVDNIAPPSPPGLRTVGGEGWRVDNDFTVIWDRPTNLVTPVVQARYRLLDSEGESLTGAVHGFGINVIESISVPGPGDYRLEVRLRDEAGNTGPPASTALRFDDAAPGSTGLEPVSRWLSSADFPAKVTVQRASAGGPSGVAGYVVGVGPPESPGLCPEGPCDPANLALRDPDERDFMIDRLAQGRHWIHAAAISGAGVPSERSSGVPVDVDLTDPTTRAEGVPQGWSRTPVTISLRAHDQESGMNPVPGHDGRQPFTAAKINDGDPVFQTGDRLAVTISSDGVHQIRHWAQDLAGNANTGKRLANGHRHDSPGIEIVKVDRTPPKLAFARGGTGAAERIAVFAHDAHSGVATGAIEFRPAGSDSSFSPLDTALVGDHLIARFPSDELPDGAYELRAVATDRAGNRATTNLRTDGSAMVLVNPVKPRPLINVSWRGERRQRVAPRPGRPAVIQGRLRDSDGRLLPRESIEMVERFDLGSRGEIRVTPFLTDDAGRFDARIATGPSRTISVRYRGSESLARSESRALRLIGRGAIRLQIGPRVARNNVAIRMRGAVRTRDALLPHGGKLVAIQYLDPDRGRWRPVEVIRTDRRGRFAYAYTFRTIAFAQRIVFRAVALPEAGWPYLPAVSRPIPIVVYPR